jgi:hypothetical protein
MQVEMVIAASGFDSSGTVKMFKCLPGGDKRESWEQGPLGYA